MSSTYNDFLKDQKFKEFNDALSSLSNKDNHKPIKPPEIPDLTPKSFQENFLKMFKKLKNLNSAEITIVGRTVNLANGTKLKPVYKVTGIFTGWKDSNKGSSDMVSTNNSILHIEISELESTDSNMGLPCPIYNLKQMTDYVKVKNRLFEIKSQSVNSLDNIITIELVNKA